MLVTLKIAVLRTGRRRRRYTRDTTNDRIVEFESSSFVFPVGTDPLEHCRSFFCDVASSSDGQGDAGGEWIRGRTCLARCISPRIGNDRTPTMCNLLTHSSTTLVVFALAKLMYPELTFATAFFIFFFLFFFCRDGYPADRIDLKLPTLESRTMILVVLFNSWSPMIITATSAWNRVLHSFRHSRDLPGFRPLLRSPRLSDPFRFRSVGVSLSILSSVSRLARFWSARKALRLS